MPRLATTQVLVNPESNVLAEPERESGDIDHCPVRWDVRVATVHVRQNVLVRWRIVDAEAGRDA